MGPVLDLRSVVSRLAKGGMDLTRRAKINSEDEFGELALDLNLFLDRICQVIEDLNEILTQETAVNQRLSELMTQMDDQLNQMQVDVEGTTHRVLSNIEHIPPSEDLTADLERLSTTLDSATKDQGISEETLQRLKQAITRYQDTLSQAQQVFHRYEQLGQSLIDITGDTRSLSHLMGELNVLQDKMEGITQSSQRLLKRLTVRQDTADEGQAT